MELIGVRAVIEGVKEFLDGMKSMQDTTTQTSSALEKLGTAAKVPTGPMKDLMSAVQKLSGAGFAALSGALVTSTLSAEEERKSVAQLTISLKNAGVAYDDVKGSLEGYLAATAKATGITDEGLRSALSQLVLITGDYDLALQALPVALDLAAAKGMDATSAAIVLGKAMEGNVGWLERYGIQIKEGATQSEVLATVQERVAGAAEAMAGPFDKLKVQIDLLADSFGAVLLPAVTAIVGALGKVIEPIASLIEKHPLLGKAIVGVTVALTALCGVLLVASSLYLSATARLAAHLAMLLLTEPATVANAIATGALAVAQGALAIASGLVTAATWAWVAAQTVLDILLSPFILIIVAVIAAIALLAAGIYLLVKHWDDVVAAFKAGWQFLSDIVTKVVAFIKQNWQYMIAGLAGPLGIAVMAIVKHWDTIKAKAVAAWDAIKSAFKTVINGIISAIQFLVDAWVKGLNLIISGLNKLKISTPSWLPSWLGGGKEIGFNIDKVAPITIPKMQYGGEMPWGGPVKVGERGPEVLMVPPASQIMPNRVTNYNVTANYAKTQAPVTLAMDLEAIRMRSRV